MDKSMHCGVPYSTSATIVSSGEYRRAPFPIGTLGAKEVDSPPKSQCSDLAERVHLTNACLTRYRG
ncbi:hypothetical protein [Desulfosporosinus sp.]|uniref:hypothetical protein n=1 Tax=Desulfosporosinus sp. TaxID=157907 RepID=UPI00261E1585|nr:hypothetical protein [Desulfosporosinus sp.]